MDEESSILESSAYGTDVYFDDDERDFLYDEDYCFEVLTVDEIVKHMLECIKEVSKVIDVSEPLTRILLNYVYWDKEKLFEKFYDGDQDELFKEAHVVNPFRKRTVDYEDQAAAPRVLTEGTDECSICYLQLAAEDMAGLECGHKFCTDCWRQYLTTKIMEEGVVDSISCAAYGCSILVDDETVMRLITDVKVRLKYQLLITNSFVECNRLLRWCPSPDCNYAIRVSYVDSKPVTCRSGHVFCFACGKNWHDPVRCNYLMRWIKKCDEDSETSNWIAANTKECPKCHATILKDGGCNHIICKNCKADFCWVCLGPWEPHGSSWYNCNKYNEPDAKAARDAHTKSRHSLQRYLFYCNRYMNHLQSLKFEHRLYAAIRDKMEEMQKHNMSWIEVQFLKKAVDVLYQCRQTLMYTYVFAYYLRRNNQSLIFEDNQRDLEHSTELLSEYLERDITQESITEIKQRVQDKYRYCESRRKVLLSHVHEGYDKDWWLYSD